MEKMYLLDMGVEPNEETPFFSTILDDKDIAWSKLLLRN